MHTTDFIYLKNVNDESQIQSTFMIGHRNISDSDKIQGYDTVSEISYNKKCRV